MNKTTTGCRLMIRKNEWAGTLSADGRHPLISGTINQTGKRDEDASTFDTREEAERLIADLERAQIITAEEADLVEIDEIDRDAPVRRMIAEVAALVGHDGTEVLRTIVECALDEDAGATAETIAEIVREARRDAAIERARGSENRGDA